jgi:thiamine pyrophosphate-dependent acetolactate synthase large subunit-like protein
MITPYEQNFGADYQRSMVNLGQAMRQIIKHFGVERLYGVGGDFAANLIAALDQDGLTVEPSSNEMHAGFCACAQAEMDGIGFCLTTYTVGSLPCVTAAALAKTEGLPVVFISGAPGEDEVHQSGIHHMVLPSNSWRAEYDAALHAFGAIGIRAERLQGDRSRGQPNISAFRFFELVKHAWLHREPVFIEVPRNLVFALTQPLCLPALNQLQGQELVFAGLDAVLATIVSRLQRARSPLVYFGVQVRRNPELTQLMLAFCHQFGIPYASDWFAKGGVDETDPLCVGTYNGAFSDPAVRSYIESSADYVLDLGSSIIPQDTASAFHTGTHFIADFANRTVVKSTVPREAELIRIVRGLMAADLPTYTCQLSERQPPALQGDAKFDFHVLGDVINQVQNQQTFGTTFVPEVGNSFFASFGLRPRATQTGINWLANPWYAAMGTSIPYARVVAETVRRKQATDRVVVITGDGGFHFQLNELIHFQKQSLAVTIIYMRNDIFHLGKSGDGPVYHCSSGQFDVLQLVRAYGGEGKRCTSIGEFSEYYSRCLVENKGTRLIEVPCLPHPQYQCREITLLNLYIQSRNGNPEAQKEWQDQKRTLAHFGQQPHSGHMPDASAL